MDEKKYHSIINFLRPFRDYLRSLNPLRFTRFDKYYFPPISNKLILNKEVKEKICLFISSRNNYQMLEKEILKNFRLDGFLVINIDDNSDQNQVVYGKKICKKNNIIFLKNRSSGLQFALKTCVEFLNKNEFKHNYILHITHDNYPISLDFFISLLKIINNKKIDFGLLGFNCFDYRLCRKDLLNLRNNKKSIGLLGRSILTNELNFITRKWYTSSNSYHFELDKLIAVECPTDTCFVINKINFEKYISVTNKIRLHNWADDIALQFLNNNIFNYSCPYIKTFNANEIKQKYGIPIWSTRDKTSKHHSGINEALNYWKQKWGWERNSYPTKELVKKKYKNTLIEEFSFYNPNKGPYKYVKN
tara:strand:+ start:389 stop:1471 length:1083 start_codon:yes stop_codon:yes gene_type:complete